MKKKNGENNGTRAMLEGIDGDAAKLFRRIHDALERDGIGRYNRDRLADAAIVLSDLGGLLQWYDAGRDANN